MTNQHLSHSYNSEQDIDSILQNDLSGLINIKINIKWWSLLAGETPKQERLFFGFIMCYIIYLPSSLAILTKPYANNIWLGKLIVISLISTIILFILWLWESKRLSKRQSSKEFTIQQLRRLKSKSSNELRMIEVWVKQASLQQLKEYELACERLLIETETNERTMANLSPVFAVLLIIAPLYIFGIQPQLPENSWLKLSFTNTAIGLPGIIALLTIILNYVNSRTAKLKIDRIAQ